MPKVIQKTLFNDTKALRLTLFLCMDMQRQEGRERDLQMGWAISIKKKIILFMFTLRTLLKHLFYDKLPVTVHWPKGKF